MNEGGPSKRQMVLENLYRGYHVVQEYVVSYWMAHLETVMRISSRMASDAQKSDAQHEWPEDMTAAIANFAERYHDDLEHTVSGRQAIEESGELDFLRHLGCFEDLVTLVGHIRSVVSVGDRRDQVSLESLGKAVDFSREILESQGESAVATQADRDRLRHWYGAKWYKCSRLTCFYFSEGFESRPAREEHRGRHERPFRCEEQDCTMFYFGFASARELEKHKNEQHPGNDLLSETTFARLTSTTTADTTEKSKHKCPICFATFPRAYNLRSHQKVHSKEKPFGCDYCGKPFARTHDRKRHQSTCKYGKNVANCVQ